MNFARLRFSVSLVLPALCSGIAVGQPANDACTGAVDLTNQTFPYTSPAVSVLDAAVDPERPMSCSFGASTIWYRYVPARSGTMTISTCAVDAPACTLPDTVVSVYRSSDGSCGTLTPVGCEDDSCGIRSRVSVVLAAGTMYYIQLGNYESGDLAAGSDAISFKMTAPAGIPADRWPEQDDAADLPGVAQVPQGEGPLGSISGRLNANDADMYRIEICNVAAFSASTSGQVLFDSQLFLFDESGLGIAANDDLSGSNYASRLTSQFVPRTGTYFLAITEYDKDPLTNDGDQLWLDVPTSVERRPDGPGGIGPVALWDPRGFEGGSYIIALTGACFPTVTCWGDCPADYNQSGGIDGADVEAFYVDWVQALSCADTNQDGGVDGADVEAFFVAWEAGGC